MTEWTDEDLDWWRRLTEPLFDLPCGAKPASPPPSYLIGTEVHVDGEDCEIWEAVFGMIGNY